MKNKRKLINDVTLFLCIFFGALASFMIFAPAFVGEYAFNASSIQISNEIVLGTHTSFGVKGTGVTGKIYSINFLSLIAYFLPLISILVAIIFGEKKLVYQLLIPLFIIAGVCAFLSILTFTSTIKDNFYTMFDYRLGVGSILSGIFSILAGVSLFVNQFIKTNNK